MVASIENLIRGAEIAVRAGAAVKALRKNGNDEAARVLEKECTAACKQIVGVAKRRRANANRASRATRDGNGRFT